MRARRLARLVSSVGILALGLGCIAPGGILARAGARPAPARGPAHERLHAALWLHTSAEYPASATRCSAWRGGRSTTRWRIRAGTRSCPPSGPSGRRPNCRPRVIADVDETLLQNAGFECAIVARNVGMDRALLATWIGMAAAPAVPGARPLLDALSERGVAIFYVTNRTADQEQATLRNLAALGFPVQGGADQLLMLGERPDWTSDKSSRRRFVAARHRVLMLLGDTLGDFVSDEGLAPAERRALAERHAERWGITWFMLPNPAYGGWEAAAAGEARDELEALRRKRERLGEGCPLSGDCCPTP